VGSNFGWVKPDNEIGIWWFSAKHATLWKKTYWLGISIMFPNEETYVYPRTVVSES